ncbi:MAG: hypothetical protein IJ881_06240 [Neisseriaceae bacterium]|nr:hypothetical protein [Neisseriaceae bacterium]
MKKTLTCALLASLFTLTACGGGGSDSPVSVNQPVMAAAQIRRQHRQRPQTMVLWFQVKRLNLKTANKRGQ